jgi:hypothetical protein
MTQGQSHHVGVALFHGLNIDRVETMILNSITAGFVQRRIGGNVGLQFGFGVVAHHDMGLTHVREYLLRASFEEGDGGDHPMLSTPKGGEHLSRPFPVGGLSQNAPIENYFGIRRNDQVPRRRLGGATRLGLGQPSHERFGRFAWLGGFVDFRGTSLEGPTHESQQLCAPW